MSITHSAKKPKTRLMIDKFLTPPAAVTIGGYRAAAAAAVESGENFTPEFQAWVERGRIPAEV